MRQAVLRTIARECGLGEIPTLSASFVDLDTDSIDVICLVSALEERFGIEFPLDTAAIGIETVGDIVRMVEEHIARREQAMSQALRTLI